ncbi:GNAT family N-acetyltransferase [Shewanella sp. yb_14]|uniref:GNAT family N-acetyltransferase n=1 Tax=Shewanella TaxID=22 RepID=UPI00370B6D6A
MNSSFELKQWESDFFNRKIFSFNYKSGLSMIKSFPVNSLIDIKLDARDYDAIDFVNRNSFEFIEGEICFKSEVRDESYFSLNGQDLENYIATFEAIEELKLTVTGLYENSRFREPWFNVSERDSFYRKWIENAVLSKFDDCCLILKDRGRISGFVTIRLKSDVATIGLIGVPKPYQGQGVAKNLLELTFEYCKSRNIKTVSVATQLSNVSASKLYIKSGFTISDIFYWFYKKV